jgi:hypothetical protein
MISNYFEAQLIRLTNQGITIPPKFATPVQGKMVIPVGGKPFASETSWFGQGRVGMSTLPEIVDANGKAVPSKR